MAFLIIIILSLLSQFFLQWWIIVPVSFFVCLWMKPSGRMAFFQSFLAIFILWTIAALFFSLSNDNILAIRVAQLLQLQSWWLLTIISGISGGLVAGISGYCGAVFYRLNLKKQ